MTTTFKVGDAVEMQEGGEMWGGFVDEVCATHLGVRVRFARPGGWTVPLLVDPDALRHVDICARCNGAGALPPPESGECHLCDGTGECKPEGRLDRTTRLPPLTPEQEERAIAAGRARLAEIERERAQATWAEAHFAGRCPRCSGPAYVGLREVECAADCEREAARRAAEVERIMASAVVEARRFYSAGRGHDRAETMWQASADTTAPPMPETHEFEATHPTRDGALAALREQVEAHVRSRR